MTDLPRLTLTFMNMALFVHRPNGLTVLLPKAGHQGTLTIGEQSRQLDGACITLLANGKRLDRRTLRTQSTRLLHLDSVLTTPFPVRPAADLDAYVSARFELGGGRLIEDEPQLKPEYQQYADTVWAIGPHQQMLTNKVSFHLPMEPDTYYSLQIQSGGTTTTIDLAREDQVIVIDNDDNTNDLFTGSLEEFRRVYDLVDLGGVDPASLPVPRLDPLANALIAVTTVRQVQDALRRYWHRECSDAPACPHGETEGNMRES